MAAVDLATLEALQNLNQPAIEQRISEKGDDVRGTRLEALRNAALGVGARGALIARTKVINLALKKAERMLDTTYSFKDLMIEGRVIPAVLTESRDAYTQDGERTILLSGIKYNIESQVRFASRAPTWREYLYMEPGEMTMSSLQLLPRDSAEREIWRKAVSEGWADGTRQADEIFEANANRLNRDFIGMTRYRILAYKKQMTLPIVSEALMPINTTGNTMTVDEQLLRITSQPAFNTDMRKWDALGQEVQRGQMPGAAPEPVPNKLPEPR